MSDVPPKTLIVVSSASFVESKPSERHIDWKKFYEQIFPCNLSLVETAASMVHKILKTPESPKVKKVSELVHGKSCLLLTSDGYVDKMMVGVLVYLFRALGGDFIEETLHQLNAWDLRQMSYEDEQHKMRSWFGSFLLACQDVKKDKFSWQKATMNLKWVEKYFQRAYNRLAAEVATTSADVVVVLCNQVTAMALTRRLYYNTHWNARPQELKALAQLRLLDMQVVRNCRGFSASGVSAVVTEGATFDFIPFLKLTETAPTTEDPEVEVPVSVEAVEEGSGAAT